MVTPYNVVFAGTPTFAVPSLKALCADPLYRVVGVLTQPDRPAGRGQKLRSSAIKDLALEQGLSIWQPTTLKSPDIQALLKSLCLDVLIVVAYGLLLPQAVLELPQYGCINVHGSILPYWRGAAPIQRSLEAGDTETGISIMQMEAGLDTGPVLGVKTTPIQPSDTSLSLGERLAEMGASALRDYLPRILAGTVKAQVQDPAQATYAKKILKTEGLLDWNEAAVILERKIRAFYPWPNAFFEYKNQRFKVGQTHVVPEPHHETPGTLQRVDSNGVVIACKEQALCFKFLQRPGGRMQPAAECFQSVFKEENL